MTQNAERKKEPFLYKYILTAISAGVAESVTFPLDITKTRLQIQGEQGIGAGAARRGMFGTMFGIVKEEGIRNLYRGLPPAVLRHFVYTGARLSFYEQMRENVLGRNPDGSFPLWKSVIGGMTSGAAAQFLASPTDLVKVQMQLEGRRRLQGLPPRYKGTFDAFKTIYKQGGMRGLWQGCVINCQRAALVNLGELTAYDTAKQTILRHTDLGDTPVVHTLSSLCAGLTAATVGTPADVVKTRIMNQPAAKEQRLYTSSVDCVVKTVRQEGVMALYKGWLPTWARMAPWSLTFWITYEQLRKLTGFSSF